MAANDVQATLDHLFRRQSGSIVSALTRVFGPENLDLAETVVQDALVKAAQNWPMRGLPDNPAGWIMQVARNQALDILRRDMWICHDSELVEKLEAPSRDAPESGTFLEGDMKDDQLRLLFICCHPALSHEARVALALKTLCGFSVPEIARAFLSKDETIAQRLVRAKRRIAELRPPFELPEPAELDQRLGSVLETIYLLFNEGYSATEGDELVRRDLCNEAIRLAKLLTSHAVGQVPCVHALIALLLLQASRLDARLDGSGEICLLEKQDRSLWDDKLISEGLSHLELAAEGEELSDYHLQAGIAACHALAPTFEETDWPRIVAYYDQLSERSHSPVVALNRAVALAMARGIELGIAEIERIRERPPMREYYLVPACLADLHRRLGDLGRASDQYRAALTLARTEPERRFLQKRIIECTEI